MKHFEMTQKQLDKIMKACKPVPMIMLQCGEPRSQQENANTAWKSLGDEMGFDYRTVKPGDGVRFFYAEPNKLEGGDS
jgi:hypothetical protein